MTCIVSVILTRLLVKGNTSTLIITSYFMLERYCLIISNNSIVNNSSKLVILFEFYITDKKANKFGIERWDLFWFA